jgi:hypothetical protein
VNALRVHCGEFGAAADEIPDRHLPFWGNWAIGDAAQTAAVRSSLASRRRASLSTAARAALNCLSGGLLETISSGISCSRVAFVCFTVREDDSVVTRHEAGPFVRATTLRGHCFCTPGSTDDCARNGSFNRIIPLIAGRTPHSQLRLIAYRRRCTTKVAPGRESIRQARVGRRHRGGSDEIERVSVASNTTAEMRGHAI